jgi:prepilin peptidase CpaA
LLGGVTFLAGIGLFAARALGGGDVKLLAAAALWAGPDHFTLFLLTTALAGGVLAMAALLWRRFAPLLALWRQIAGLDVLAARPVLPYGVAIAAGGVAVALRLLGS